MRDIYKALAGFEAQFEEVYGLSLNEAMILCALQEAQKEICLPVPKWELPTLLKSSEPWKKRD